MSLDDVFRNSQAKGGKRKRENESNLGDILKNDYTLEDFKKESFDRRLEMLTTAVDLIPRALLLLSLEYGKVYTRNIELKVALLRYLGISLTEFRRNKNAYAPYLPMGTSAYLSYVEPQIKGGGAMTKAKLTTKVWTSTKKHGYALTSFGKDIKPFVSYILKKCAEYKINPSELFGKTLESGGKRGPMISIKMLKYVYEKGEAYIVDIAKDLGLSLESPVIENHLLGFKELGLIEYRGFIHYPELAKRYPIIRITEKGRKVYEEIIKPILEVAESPSNITKYWAELTNEDKWNLLEIYSSYKSRPPIGKRKWAILLALREKDGLTLEEIADKTGLDIRTVDSELWELKGMWIVKDDWKGRWYINHDMCKSLLSDRDIETVRWLMWLISLGFRYEPLIEICKSLYSYEGRK